MDAIIVDPVRSLRVARDGGEVDEVLGLAANLLPEVGAIVGGERVAEDLHPAPVVHPRNALHEVGGWVIAEVTRHVADSDPTIRGQVGTEPIGRLVENLDLLKTELGMAAGDGFPELVGEWIEHRVVRVHRRQTVLLQLVSHDRDQRLAPVRVVRPVADDLRRKTDYIIALSVSL